MFDIIFEILRSPYYADVYWFVINAIVVASGICYYKELKEEVINYFRKKGSN